MARKVWTPDKGLSENGWYFFSFGGEEFREKTANSGRFLSTMTLNTDWGNEIYVRAFPSIPNNQNPNGGYIQVGCRTPNEPIDDKYMGELEDVFKRITGRVDVESTLVLPGPFYVPSPVVEGHFEKVNSYDEIIWMR